MSNKNFVVSLVGTLLILLSAIALVVVMNIAFKKEPIPKKTFENVRFVKADTVSYSKLNSEVVAYGRLKSINKIQIFSEVQGILESSRKDFKTGNRFSKGQVMISVDDRQTKLDLRSARSQFLSLISSIMPDLKSDYPDAFSKWDSYLKNFDINNTLVDLPEASSSKEKYFISSRNIYNQFYNIRNLELRLTKHKIEAPFSGVVISHNVEKGALIRPGQLLGEFASLGSYELELAVNENDYKFIAPGSDVVVYDDENGKSWQGKVSRLADNIDPQTQTIKTYVMLTGNDLKDGMYLRAVIDGKDLESVYEIDRSALINNQFVHTINDSILSKQEIQIQKLNQKTAYICGLDSGSVVIIEPLANVALGTKVKAIEE